ARSGSSPKIAAGMDVFGNGLARFFLSTPAGSASSYRIPAGRNSCPKRISPLSAMCIMLFAYVLRRVDHAWANLHGEAELDDILIMSALRYGAEPVYRFLLADIDAARHEPDDMFPRTKNIKDEWTRVLAEVTAGSEAQKLVDLMGIEQLTKDTICAGTDSPQGVQ